MVTIRSVCVEDDLVDCCKAGDDLTVRSVCVEDDLVDCCKAGDVFTVSSHITVSPIELSRIVT